MGGRSAAAVGGTVKAGSVKLFEQSGITNISL
jgi:hypothetical protein